MTRDPFRDIAGARRDHQIRRYLRSELLLHHALRSTGAAWARGRERRASWSQSGQRWIDGYTAEGKAKVRRFLHENKEAADAVVQAHKEGKKCKFGRAGGPETEDGGSETGRAGANLGLGG